MASSRAIVPASGGVDRLRTVTRAAIDGLAAEALTVGLGLAADVLSVAGPVITAHSRMPYRRRRQAGSTRSAHRIAG
ncbi:hypothetical protein GCM10029978_016190 [Actinoallomurus acanthiterrae]